MLKQPEKNRTYHLLAGEGVHDPDPSAACRVQTTIGDREDARDRLVSEQRHDRVGEVPGPGGQMIPLEDSQWSGGESDPHRVAVVLDAADVGGQRGTTDLNPALGIGGGIQDDSGKRKWQPPNWKHDTWGKIEHRRSLLTIGSGPDQIWAQRFLQTISRDPALQARYELDGFDVEVFESDCAQFLQTSLGLVGIEHT